MRTLTTAILIACLAPCLCAAPSGLGQAAASAEADLADARGQFNSLLEQVAKEKIPLVKDVESRENVILGLNRELRDIEVRKAAVTRGQAVLDKEVARIDGDIAFVQGMARDFFQNFTNRMAPAEAAFSAGARSEIASRIASGALDPEAAVLEQLKVVDLALDRLGKAVGGYVEPGVAVAPSGTLVEGRFAIVGPAIYFASGDGAVAGVADRQAGSGNANCIDIGPGNTAAVSSAVRDGRGELPMDASMGKALRMRATEETFSEHLAKGAEIGYIIVALGVVSALMVLAKFAELGFFRVRDPEPVLARLRSGAIEDAAQAAEKVGGITGILLRTGIRHHDAKRGTLEELLYEKVLGIRPRLERFLPLMAVITTAAPLLGLLGTVTGMITTFKVITAIGGGDAKSLAGGISEALVTTELGLSVAIPTLIFHGFLGRRAKALMGEVEAVAVALLNTLTHLNNRRKSGAPVPADPAVAVMQP